jgi:hypothetical protein
MLQALPWPTPEALLPVAIAFALIRLSGRFGMWAYALAALPGTMAHEFAHWLVALVLGAQPQFPRLLPERTVHGWRLGSVRFRPGMFRAVPIVLAPFALLPLAWWWTLAFVTPADWPWRALHAWIAASLLSASLPSRADFRIALPALAIGGALAAAIALWLSLR